MERDTTVPSGNAVQSAISTHTPRVERDMTGIEKSLNQVISTHTPRVERDGKANSDILELYIISTHTPRVERDR